MSDKLGGSGKEYCDVCGRKYTWGCGHSSSQEAKSRAHDLTEKHIRKECKCYGHDYCDPKKCKLAGVMVLGYVPFKQHTPKP
jgi:hypothetical protein